MKYGSSGIVQVFLQGQVSVVPTFRLGQVYVVPTFRLRQVSWPSDSQERFIIIIFI